MSQNIFAIARSGMDVEHARLEIIAQNLANAGTTRTATGEDWTPLRLVSGPRASHMQDGRAFAARLAGDMATTGTGEAAPLGIDPSASVGAATEGPFNGVQVFGVEPENVKPHLVYDPSHPHADANGFVHYPGLDHAGEMALMVQTLRVYEANTVMFNAARSMYMRALDLGSKG